MNAIEQIERVEKEFDALTEELQLIDQRIGDTVADRVRQEKEFDLVGAIGRKKEIKQKLDDLSWVLKQLKLTAQMHELKKEKERVHKEREQLTEERLAEQKVIDDGIAGMSQGEREAGSVMRRSRGPASIP